MTGRRLTCHVLDATVGRPAAGVALAVRRLDGVDAGLVLEARTDDDGRSGGPLLADDAFTPGRYEISFALGDHFGLPSAERYLDVVPIRFGAPAGDDVHVHVAVLATPWSYTTYRGS